MTRLLATHMIGQNQYGLLSPASNQSDSTRIGTTGCALCVGLALWRESDGKALVAHIQPDQLHKIKESVDRIYQLIPDPGKFLCVTAGADKSTNEIVDSLVKTYGRLPIVKQGYDEISIVSGTGAIKVSRTSLIQTDETRPPNFLTGDLS